MTLDHFSDTRTFLGRDIVTTHPITSPNHLSNVARLQSYTRQKKNRVFLQRLSNFSFSTFLLSSCSETDVSTMCVTNTTYRRSQPIFSLAEAQQQQQQQPAGCPSGLTQRLLSTFNLAAQQNVGEFLAALQGPQSAEFSVAQPPSEKPRAKRRRKPQKPGKTAKMNDRHFVVHNYHDHSNDPIDTATSDEDHCDHSSEDPSHHRKGGVATAFPLKLHAVLDQVEADGLAHVISWQPHGRSFVIHQPKEFVDLVMPK